jgi:hypothetical protein
LSFSAAIAVEATIVRVIKPIRSIVCFKLLFFTASSLVLGEREKARNIRAVEIIGCLGVPVRFLAGSLFGRCIYTDLA